MTNTDRDAWLETGIRNGWITKPVCGMHDGSPLTEDEAARMDDGEDPCFPIVRLLEPGEIVPVQ